MRKIIRVKVSSISIYGFHDGAEGSEQNIHPVYPTERELAGNTYKQKVHAIDATTTGKWLLNVSVQGRFLMAPEKGSRITYTQPATLLYCAGI